MRIIVVVKRNCENCYSIAKNVLEYGERELSLDMCIDIETADQIHWKSVCRAGHDNVEAAIVIGGDGTLFRFLHKAGNLCDIPIFTVKAGRRSFLMEVRPEDVLKRIRDFVEGRYRVEEYMRIRPRILGKDAKLPLAINDVVVSSWGSHKYKVISLNVYVNDEKLYEVTGDGVIVATPVGSTAYALSAGGPIVDHHLQCFVIVPLAPIQFNAKPVVVSSEKKISVEVIRGEAAVVVDGEITDNMFSGDVVEISKEACPVKLVRFSRFSTYARLYI
ncbi:NAD(+)/NADH kinase [Ignisphaera sp. 4213-co]|uniref:NAD kinase n=1 Tax=Ignisphaera cupida TaxID=3050454 RepID=A0ABD4Z547_9CREN|nr:NAD(+)/NADH kinase [Ignisphaera sp. 4213-co]MDK6028431.1 NAD(+)/NADH kinase [Ignisphaera sp. 4213-co]